jgi:hypothetical protein
VYSYAIHPEVRAKLYGLCNGKRWVFWKIDKFEPILNITIEELEESTSSIEKVLNPEYVIFHEKKDFLPDFGLALLKSGMKQDLKMTLIDNLTDNIMKVEDGLYTIMTSIADEDSGYVLALDLTEEIFYNSLNHVLNK